MPNTNKDYAYSGQHIIERAQERYDIRLTGADYDALNLAIERAATGDQAAATLLGKEKTDEFWSVPWPLESDGENGDKNDLVCVWSTESKRITTLLPKGTVIKSRRDRKKG